MLIVLLLKPTIMAYYTSALPLQTQGRDKVGRTHTITTNTDDNNIQLIPYILLYYVGIVLGIGVDNSGSMSTLACDINETGGKAFTRLDLTKHTLRVLIGMLEKQDMLYIIKFDDKAYVVLEPTAMTAEGKEKANLAVKSIQTGGSTNVSLYTQLCIPATYLYLTSSNVFVYVYMYMA